LGEGNSERIDLERMQLVFQKRISSELLGAAVSVDEVFEFAADTIIAEARLKLAGMPIAEEMVTMPFESPATWWQMFRRDVLRRPCRMRTDTQRKEVRLMAGVPEALLRITHGAGPIHYWTTQGDACDGRGK